MESTRRQFVAGSILGMAGAACISPMAALADEAGVSWDFEADVVVVGSGGSGLPAALKAFEDGSSVIVVEANWDCGGHASVSGGTLHSGCGTELQKKYGIEDSSDQYYIDHTMGSLTVSRLNDRTYIRSIADSMAEAYQFIQDKGVIVMDKEPDKKYSYQDGGSDCDSIARWTYADASTEGWEGYFGKDEGGVGLTRPLERTAREQGVQFLMNYHMDKIYREGEGRVSGICASHTPHTLPGATEPLVNLMANGNLEFGGEVCNIKANKGIVIATGGTTGNLVFRTAYDPRLGPEFDGLAGMPFSDQDASGEIAAMKIGAALGDMANYQQKGGHTISMAKRVGCRYGYGAGYTKQSVLWPLLVATGVPIDKESTILVNMLGARCGNEDLGWHGKYYEDTYEYFDTALHSVVIDDPQTDGDAVRYGGPIWAIFDQAAADRNDWDMEQGTVDYDNGYCFKADTLEELAQAVVNKYYEQIEMSPETLVATVEAYNAAVDSGVDEEWGRTTLVNKIETGPFYCAWAMPELHDTYGGLRANGDMQVIDITGNLIPGLFACGESSAGQRTHGLGRVITSGYIAGRSAAAGGSEGVAVSAPQGWGEMAVYAEPVAEDDSAFDASAPLNDGTYAGSSNNGMGGQLSIEITVSGGAITDIQVTKQSETKGIGDAALPTLVEEALASQLPGVEAVSGASVTSAAFNEALTVAMEKAQGK